MTPIHPNARVYCPDQPERGFGEVRLVEENLLADERICQVAFEWSPGLVALPESALRLVPQFAQGATIEAGSLGDVEWLRRRLGAALVMAENSQNAAFIRSFTLPLPHQAFLLEKVISGRRLGHIIADDVGMGKTIEAGLLIASLRQRDPRCRVLVACPAGVVLQWQDEMDEHFGLTFHVAGRDFKPDRPANWESHDLVVGSLDTLKQERLRDVFQKSPAFDLVICDEAHRLTAKRDFLSNDLRTTQNFRFLDWLTKEHRVSWEEAPDGSPRSPRLILMSATPHQGDDLRFAYLLQLVRPDQLDAEQAIQNTESPIGSSILEECVTRTAKRRAVDWNGRPIFNGHDTRTLDVPLNAPEKAALRRLAQYVASEMVFKETRGEALVRALAMHTFQKIAASSWVALEAAMQRRVAQASGVTSSHARPNPIDESVSLGEEFAVLGGGREAAALQEVLDCIRAVTNDSKWQTFQDLMQPGNGFREPGDRVLIFTQYRVTQSWLAAELEKAGEVVAQIHGGLTLDQRKTQRAAFEREATVMLSTEAGSEGANLHRGCHLMVNYDLPWNPMRLLQRIGRLDRYGQKHRVRVANLKSPESWDARISAKIETKLEAIQSRMGQVADEDYRAMILGGIHEAIDVAEVMHQCQWGASEKGLEEAIDKAVASVLSRKSSLDALFRESLGMPAKFQDNPPELDSEAFRQAFAWAAAAHGISLKESRTSDNQRLPGVHHFTLPPAFRGGLRASTECHVVFDRERYAAIRGLTLGRARGQDIKPTLAGFGDPVTDWFFRRALQAENSASIFALQKPADAPPDETWWIVHAARWKTGKDWIGPDLLLAFGLTRLGEITRPISTGTLFQKLSNASSPAPSPTALTLPPLALSLAACKNHLRSRPDVVRQSKHLHLWPIAVMALL